MNLRSNFSVHSGMFQYPHVAWISFELALATAVLLSAATICDTDVDVESHFM